MAQQKLLNARIKWKRDTASNWESKDPVLLNGEIIIVDTAAGDIRFKVGDGTKKYSQLPFTDEGLKQDIANAAKTTVSNTITNETTAGPKLTTTVNGVSATAVTIPAATTDVSGVVTTGEQNLKGNKNFSGALRILNTSGTTNYLAFGSASSTNSYVFLNHKGIKYGTISGSSSSAGAYIDFSLREASIYGNILPAGGQAWNIGSNTAAYGNVYAAKFNGIATKAEALTSTSIGSATKPVYFDANGKPIAITHTIESDVPANAKFTDTNTTYTASNGVTLTGTNFTNSGVRAISKGTTNGTISVNTNGTAAEVAVAGLGSAAYTASTAYTPAAHATNKSNPHEVTAAQVGAIPTTQKGAKSGVAELDENGFVPSSQLPSYVDDVLEYDAKAKFPTTGETGKIYVDKTTNLTWRWGGTAYVEISPSLAIGTTSSTAFRGDYGNTAYTHAVTNKGKAFSSGLYKITTNAEGHVTAATAVQKSDIVGLGIPSTNTTYEVMGAATASAAGTKGLVPAPAAGKQNSFLRGDGTWVVPTDHTYNDMTGASASAAGTHGLVPAPAAGKNTSFLRGDGTWVVPTDHIYTAGTGLSLSSGQFSHSNSVTAKTAYGSTATSASANGGSITVTDVKYDAQGHIIGSTDRTIKLSQTTYTLAGLMGSTAKGSATQPVYWNGTAWTNTTYTLGKSVPSDAKFTDTVYSLPTASSTLGGVKTTSTVTSASGYTACPIVDGVVYYKDTNNTYTLAGLMGSTAKGSTTNPVYWDGTAFKTITSYGGTSNKANTLATARKISLSTGVTGTATEFNGSKDITIPVTSIKEKYLSWGGKNIVGDIAPVDASMSGMLGGVRSNFMLPAGITIEYSTDSGATWTDYGASNSDKRALVSECASMPVLKLGKYTNGATRATDQLRITIDGVAGGVYFALKTICVYMTSGGATGCKCKVEHAQGKAGATGLSDLSFVTDGIYNVDGWSGWNSIPCSLVYGGTRTRTDNSNAIRLTFSITTPYSQSQQCGIFRVLMLGTTCWSGNSNQARYGTVYQLDENQNATFPAQVAATKFKGALTNALTLNGKTYNGSAAVNVGTIGIAYGGTGATTAAAARTSLGITPANIGAATASHNHDSVYLGKTATAAAATKLATARTIKIGNQSLTFDGTKDITFTTAAMGITTTAATIHRYTA